MADGYLLSAASIRQLQADHRALRAAITRLERQIQPSAYNPPDWGRELWWGKTAIRAGETYPTPPNNVYTVQLSSRTFDPTSHGEQTSTPAGSDPGDYVTARTVTGVNLPEGTPVVLERQSSVDGVRWWIRPPLSTLRRATASEDIAAGASGDVAIKVSGLSDETVTAYYTWADAGKPTIASGDEIFVEWDEEQKKWIVIPPGVESTYFYVRNEYSNLTSGRGLELGEQYSAGVIKADIRTDCTRAYAILAEDINVNTIGKAKVSGFATARVNVLKTEHTHCYLPASETVFKTGFGGPLELCRTPTATGAQDILVRWQPMYRRRVVTAYTLLANNVAQCNFYIGPGVGSLLGQDDVYFNWMKGGVASIASGVEGWATWDDGPCIWVLDSAECD
jgi:hypothetical protein